MARSPAAWVILKHHGRHAEDKMDGLVQNDGSVQNEIRGILAPLSFMVPMAEKPIAYNYEPPPGVPQRTGRQEDYEVLVRDGRAVADKLSLDHEGFVLESAPTRVSNFYDESQIVS